MSKNPFDRLVADAVALKEVGPQLHALRATLATTQAELRDARAEIATAERRGMERERRAQVFDRRREEYQDNASRLYSSHQFQLGAEAERKADTARKEAAAIRAALPPPSDAAPAASEERVRDQRCEHGIPMLYSCSVCGRDA